MKQNTSLWILLLTGLSAGLVLGEEFSADMVRTMTGQTSSGKVYVKGDLVRMETTLPMPGGKTVVILNVKSGKTIILQPAQKMYMEMVGQKDAAAWVTKDEDYAKLGADRKLVGAEEVNGYKCRKYEVTFKNTAMGKTTQWISEKLMFPVKIVHSGPGGEMVQELKNIKDDKVPDSLFKIPDGYTKMNVPGMP